VDAVERALGEEAGDRVAVVGAAVDEVGEDDGDVLLRAGADGDPRQPSLATSLRTSSPSWSR
jgi:hypothetical protein